MEGVHELSVEACSPRAAVQESLASSVVINRLSMNYLNGERMAFWMTALSSRQGITYPCPFIPCDSGIYRRTPGDSFREEAHIAQ